jgi:predicted transcriptional regulator
MKMSRKSLGDLGQLQRSVIELVWDLGEASVHQVRERLRRKKKLAYTTILTTLQKLEKAGWLRHRSEGKVYVYTPMKTRKEAGVGSVRKFVFGQSLWLKWFQNEDGNLEFSRQI